MSNFTWYDAGTTTIGVNAKEVSQRLGELRRKTPAVIKVAVNATARETRKEMLRRVLKRYALTAKGKERAKGLKQKVKATNADPAAVLRIGGINGARADLAYFQHRVTVPHPGLSWQTGPTVFKARVLRSGGLHDLGGGPIERNGMTLGQGSKGFLAEFKSGHVGMIQRHIGAASRETTTKSGAPRWRSASGVMEKTRTYGSPSGTAQHHTVWEKEDVHVYAENTLNDRLEKQIAKVMARAAKG